MLVKITVAVGPEAEEGIAEALMEESPAGIGIEEASGALLISAFVPSERVDSVKKIIAEKATQLQSVGLEVGTAAISVEPVDEKEWATVYREYFHIEHIGRIVVRPTWEPYEQADDEVVISLDPGLAFGTGSHPTTRGCLLALQKHLEPGWTVLDVGTGSGILAIAAAKLGAERVVAIDTDPVAVGVARENVEANGESSGIELIDGGIEAVKGSKADLILANITAPDIIAILPSLMESIADWRVAIFSGILQAQACSVEEALSDFGLTATVEEPENGWVTLVTKRG